MGYFIDPSQLSAMFPMPAAVADKHLKLADEIQLKALIYIMRHSAEEIRADVISAALGVSEEQAEDAVLFWVQCGVLGSNATLKETKKPEEKAVVVKTEKPSRLDVARRGNEDVKIRMLLSEAQAKFGRNIKDNEARTLVWLYDDCGMEVSVILMLLQFAKSKEKCNIRFVEKTAQEWLKNGVETISDAESYIAKQARDELAWSAVCRVFGIERRKPTAKEQTFATLWIDNWNISPEILGEAYNECIDKKGKLIFSYLSAILENWRKQGVKTVEDLKGVKENQTKSQAHLEARKHSYAGYDISALEELINK